MILRVNASKLDRVMKCAGSLGFTDLPKDEDTAVKSEGIAASEYLEHLLKGSALPSHARNGTPFTDDMKFYLVPIAEEIKAKAKGQINSEIKVDWQSSSGIVIASKYDVAYIDENGDLNIEDLKWGWGLVEVKENWQTIAYAIGEVIRLGKAPNKINLRVRQPRPHHEDGPSRTWTINYTELLKYKDKIEERMFQIKEGVRTLYTGDHCKYCPAAGSHCPAISKAMFRGIDLVHEFIQDNISDEELSFQLDLMDRIDEVFKTKKSSLEQLANDRLKNGRIIPNYVSEQSYGDRYWKTDVTPDLIKMLTGKDITTTVTLSPHKAEKIGVPKDLVAKMTERKFLGAKLKRKNTAELGNKIFGAAAPKGLANV